MITDCYWGGWPTKILTQQQPRLALPQTGRVCSGNEGLLEQTKVRMVRNVKNCILFQFNNIEKFTLRECELQTVLTQQFKRMGIFKKQDAAYWIVLSVIILILYFVFSDGQFSLIFTLSGTVQTFGFALVVIKIRKSRSVGGLSKQTFICYTLIFTIRSVLFLFYKGYLPFDSTGDIIFKLQEILGTVLAGYILYCIVGPFRTSYNRDIDVIKSWYLIVVAAFFAVLFHSNLNRSVWADFGWAFSQYLQTIAILSQFILFNKKGGEIQTYTSHFIAAQAISRILSLIFWIFTYTQLNEYNRSKASSLLPQYVGHWFMIAQVIHLFIMADFMYYWIKALKRGEGVQLPTYI